MRSSLPSLAVIFLLHYLLVPSARADEVVLQGGTLLRGVVLEQGKEEVRLLLTQGAEIRLRAADVSRVEEDERAPGVGHALRYVEEKADARLDAAVIHLMHPDGRHRVDLIGMVHVADAAFYRNVQALLEQADVVLFEGVTRKEDPLGEDEESEIGRLQRKLATWLALAYQGEGIVYGRPHYRHADLTEEEILALLGADSDADLDDVIAELQGSAVLRRIVEPLIDLLTMLSDAVPVLRQRIKRGIAEVLARQSTEPEVGLPPELWDALIVKRDAKVLERLGELDEGTYSVAVIYGAGHLPDLERRLVEDKGYRRAGAQWLTAWAMPGR